MYHQRNQVCFSANVQWIWCSHIQVHRQGYHGERIHGGWWKLLTFFTVIGWSKPSSGTLNYSRSYQWKNNNSRRCDTMGTGKFFSDHSTLKVCGRNVLEFWLWLRTRNISSTLACFWAKATCWKLECVSHPFALRTKEKWFWKQNC